MIKSIMAFNALEKDVANILNMGYSGTRQIDLEEKILKIQLPILNCNNKRYSFFSQ